MREQILSYSLLIPILGILAGLSILIYGMLKQEFNIFRVSFYCFTGSFIVSLLFYMILIPSIVLRSDLNEGAGGLLSIFLTDTDLSTMAFVAITAVLGLVSIIALGYYQFAKFIPQLFVRVTFFLSLLALLLSVLTGLGTGGGDNKAKVIQDGNFVEVPDEKSR